MKTRFLLFIGLLTCLSFSATAQVSSPLSSRIFPWFEHNSGQFHENIQFINRRATGTLVFSDHCISQYRAAPGINTYSNNLNKKIASILCFKNTRLDATLRGIRTLPGPVNYLTGQQKKNRHTGIKRFHEMLVENIYPGIDMRFYNNGDDMAFDFIVAPGASAELIALQAAASADILKQEDNSLLIVDGDTRLRLSAPVVYQVIDERRVSVSCEYHLDEDKTIRLRPGSYDQQHVLVIDPVLSGSSYLGGSDNDYGFAMSGDAAGNVYIAGYTASVDLPLTANAYQNRLGGFASAFVAKFSPPPASLPLYITYAGNDVAEVRAMAVDNNGNAYVTGSTSSTSFPTVNAFQTSKAGIIDGYIFKLNTTGDALVYSTYFGGNSVDRGRAIALDSSGNAYVTGVTASTSFPVVNAWQDTNAGIQDAYVLQLSATGNALVYSTYLGGSGGDYGADIHVDDAGFVYITGNSTSSDYPLLNAQQAVAGGGEDGIVSILNNQGELIYSSYLGGSGNDYATRIALDSAGNMILAGSTQSINFPGLQVGSKPLQGGQDGFVSRINPMSPVAHKSVLIGGDASESILAMAIDPYDDIHMAGVTTSNNLPVQFAIQSSYGGGPSDGFINTLDIDSGTHQFMSYLGGSDADSVRDAWLDNQFNLLLAGETRSIDFPLQSAYQAVPAGESDAFVSVISLDIDHDLVPDYDDNCIHSYNPLQEDDDNDGIGNACEAPVITGFWPGSASPGDFIFVFGSGFISQDTRVEVNSIAVSLLQVVTPDMLIFALPGGDTNGPVSVSTSQGSAISAIDFGSDLTGLDISGIWPGQGVRAGDFVFVFGAGFQDPISVTLGSMNIPLVQIVNDDMLIFMVPTGSTTATLTITSQGQSVTSSDDLIILN